MKNKKIFYMTAFRYFIPAEYEAWFEKLAMEGWHPQKVGQWSSIAMTFIKSEPKKYRYVIDMQAFPKKDYKATYEEFGWEFVGQMASAFVWRKEYSDVCPESFSDKESVIKRNNRFVKAISFSFGMFLLASICILVFFAANLGKLIWSDYLQYILGLLLSVAFTGYLGWIMKKIYKSKDK